MAKKLIHTKDGLKTITHVLQGAPADNANAVSQSGSWTPALKFGGNSSGLTYTTQLGRYIKIGDLVIVWGFIAINAKGSSTGSTTIQGLPFPATTLSGMSWPGRTCGDSGADCDIDSGGSTINVFNDNTAYGNGDVIEIHITYRTG